MKRLKHFNHAIYVVVLDREEHLSLRVVLMAPVVVERVTKGRKCDGSATLLEHL
jgi:hypothetical protein